MADAPHTSRAELPLEQRLDALIEELTRAYESLDELADARRRAVSTADIASLAQCVRDENEIVQRIAQLEREREQVVELASGGGDRNGSDSLTLTQIASTCAQPWRDGLMDAARRLRTLIERVHQKHASARLAAEKLARHMQGLLRSVESAHSHTGAYNRTGSVRMGAPVVSAMDVTT